MAFAHSKEKDLGKPLCNVLIEINCYTREFKDSLTLSALDHIEAVGMAIHKAKELLFGWWTLTEKGFLVKGKTEGIKSLEAVLDADIHTFDCSFLTLERILNKEIECEHHHPHPHIHFKDEAPKVLGKIGIGKVEEIGGDANGLYIISIHEQKAGKHFED